MSEILVIIGIFILSSILIYKKPDVALYILLILSTLLHKELFSFYRWDLLPVRIFTISIGFVFLVKAFTLVKRPRTLALFFNKLKDPLFIALVFLWVVRGVSIIFTLNLPSSLLLYILFTTIVVLSLFIYLRLKDNPEKSLHYLRFYSYTAFVLTLFGYFQIALFYLKGITIGALWSIPGNTPRVGSLFWDVNHYGALLAALLPFTAVSVLNEQRIKNKIVNLVMTLSMAGALFITNSRSAWIMAGVSILVFLVILLVRKFGYKGIGFVLGALVLISVPILYGYSIKSSPFRAKIKQYFHYRMDSFDSHMYLLTGTVQIFEKYPFLGGGYGSFFEHFSKTKIAPTYFGRDPAALNTRVPAHTIWGELIAETGVLGLVAYVVLFSIVLLPLLYIGLKYRDREDFLVGTAFFSVLIGWLVAGIFYSYNSEFFWIITFLFAAWGFAKIKYRFNLCQIFSALLYKQRVAFIILTILSVLLIFLSLGSHHLIPYDEAIYAKISKNMLTSGNYIVQEWVDGKVWYEKPPLYMWMMAGLMKVMGINSWAAKLPSAVLGFSTIIVVYLFAKKMFGKVGGFLSALVLLTTFQYLYYTRMAMLDVSATFFITLALYFYYQLKVGAKGVLWSFLGLSIGLAVMIKGVVGLMPFGVIAIFELYEIFVKRQRITKNTLTGYLLALFSSALVFLPWHIEMYRKFGNEFLNNYIIYHVWDRATSAIEDKGRPFWWYSVVLKVSMRIWFIALLGALPLAVSKIIKKSITGYRDDRMFLLVIWSLTVFLFFSAATSKLVWYIMPIYPALAMLVGYFLSRVINKLKDFIKISWREFYVVIAVSLITISALFYLFLNKNLVYTSDLTGSQARLLIASGSAFGPSQKLYIDRVESPLVLFYCDNPYEEIDFNAQKGRIPDVDYGETLVLLTKTGRFTEEVPGFEYKPKVVLTDGDWILWYLESHNLVDNKQLKNANERIAQIQSEMLGGNTTKSMEYYQLLNTKKYLEHKILTQTK